MPRPTSPTPFFSFWQGGFEGSTHRRQDSRQLDIIAGAGHDTHAATDYRLLHRAGVRTVRDALRWHLIESTPGEYDWSSWLPMLRAARDAGVQVVWDLCHYGLPHWLDIWSPGFPARFQAFAEEAALLHRQEVDAPPIWCPVNEMSFWAWYGGTVGGMYPGAINHGWEMKRQLVRAAISATRAARAVDARARFITAEPLIHVVADTPEEEAACRFYTEVQFEACDMLAGRVQPELGGSEELLDIVGVNFYWNNQWVHNGGTVALGHPEHRPLHLLLADVHARYNRPLLLSETGAEGASGPAWLRSVAGEVRTALRAGLPVLGLCLYPVMDYPGWDDDRHCPCGLIRLDAAYQSRSLAQALLVQLEEEMALTAPLVQPLNEPLPFLLPWTAAPPLSRSGVGD